MKRHILGIDISTMVESVAAHLAHMDSDQQAAFFRVFAEELTKACGTYHHADMQAHAIRNMLNNDQRAVYRTIGHEKQS
jgi:hypothetical protein